MVRSLIGLVSVLMLTACGTPAEPVVDGAWVRLPAVAGRPGAAYFTLKGGARGATLTALRTPSAARIELHESMMVAGGAMSMTATAAVVVPTGRTVAFAPGGRHAMLFGLSPTVKPGDTLPLTFTFADGASVGANARVIAAGDTAPTG